VPLKSKKGSVVAEAFGSILRDSRYMKPRLRRPLVVQTDKGKEYVNQPFQDFLRREGIEHRICRNPDVKCAVVGRIHRTIREIIYRYFHMEILLDTSIDWKNLYQVIITPFT
jgi:hypothetical protein